MEGTEDAQSELLTKIHDQLVDLKRVIIEIELARPGTAPALQAKLQEILSGDQHLGASSGSSDQRQQKVIAPTDLDIQPGEARAQ